jgi:hypothetical protein
MFFTFLSLRGRNYEVPNLRDTRYCSPCGCRASLAMTIVVMLRYQIQHGTNRLVTINQNAFNTCGSAGFNIALTVANKV